MEKDEDLIAMAEWQIEQCGRPSAEVSKELLKELKLSQEEARNGSDWFNAYQSIDNFLEGHLKEDFPVDSKVPEENTISAIIRLVTGASYLSFMAGEKNHKKRTRACQKGK